MLRKEGKGVDVELGMEPWRWAAIYRRVGSDQVMDDFSSKKNKIIVLVQQLEHGLTSEKKDDITLPQAWVCVQLQMELFEQAFHR